MLKKRSSNDVIGKSLIREPDYFAMSRGVPSQFFCQEAVNQHPSRKPSRSLPASWPIDERFDGAETLRPCDVVAQLAGHRRRYTNQRIAPDDSVTLQNAPARLRRESEVAFNRSADLANEVL